MDATKWPLLQFIPWGRCWSILCHKHPQGIRHVYAEHIPGAGLLLWEAVCGNDAPKPYSYLSIFPQSAPIASFGHAGTFLPSELVCFCFDTQSGKNHISVGAETGSAEWRKAENQIVRSCDTLYDFRPSQTKDDHDQKRRSCCGTTGLTAAVVTVFRPNTVRDEILTPTGILWWFGSTT